jgi:hypothetical protein
MTVFRLNPRSMPVQICLELSLYSICCENKHASSTVSDVDPYVNVTPRCYFQHTSSIHTPVGNSNVLAQGFASIRSRTQMDFSNEHMQICVPMATGKPSSGISISVAMNSLQLRMLQCYITYVSRGIYEEELLVVLINIVLKPGTFILILYGNFIWFQFTDKYR